MRRQRWRGCRWRGRIRCLGGSGTQLQGPGPLRGDDSRYMKARGTTYTETLSLVGNYMTRDRSGFADIPVIVSVVGFTALAGLAVSTVCLVRGTIDGIRGVIALLMWVQQQVEDSNRRAKVRYGPSGRPPRRTGRVRQTKGYRELNTSKPFKQPEPNT